MNLPTAVSSGLLLAVVFAGTAQAAEPELLTVPSDDPSSIYGGTTTAVCGWPTTVSMQGSCTGTLVHPEIVVYAAHCGGGYPEVWLGENIQSPQRTVKTQFCRTYPGGQPGQGTDLAFCKLATPVLDVPIVPILMGCETEAMLKPGQEVTIVGFGQANNGPYGIKREVVTTINGIQGNEAFIGGGGKDSCQGDSGGPVYVQLPDNSWRVFGVTSYGGQCGGGGYYSMMHTGIEWFEQEAGVDLTPCFSVNGTWQPTWDCGEFPLTPGDGGSSWNMGCGGGPVSGFSNACGAAFNPEPDMTPPEVSIVVPMDGQVFETEGGQQLTVIVEATDVGWGIEDVQLILNDKDLDGALDNFEPYEFPMQFPDGVWCLRARARDKADNTAESETVCIGVNKEIPPPPPPPDEPEGTTGGSDSGSGSDSDPAPTTGDDSSDDVPTTNPTNDTSNPSSPGSGSGNVDDSSGTNVDIECDCREGTTPGPLSLLSLLGTVLLLRRRRAAR